MKRVIIPVIPVFDVVVMVLSSLAGGEVTTRVIWVGSTVSSEGQINKITFICLF